MEKVDWILGAVKYSLLIALIPGAIFLLGIVFRLDRLTPLMSTITNAGWIFYPLVVLAGVVLQIIRPLNKPKTI